LWLETNETSSPMHFNQPWQNHSTLIYLSF
jgi:hypothetical protein